MAGAAIQWLRDELKIWIPHRFGIYGTESTGYQWLLCGSGIYRTRCSVLGSVCKEERSWAITRGVNKYHIIRATLESLAYQVNDVLVAMEADSGIRLAALKVDGGASANNFLMQTQADIIQAPVNRPQCVETTAMGAAYLAGLAVGYWSDKEEVIKNWAIDQIFEPKISEEERKKKLKGWKKAVKYAYGWAKED